MHLEKSILGIELGSTRIKAVLIDENDLVRDHFGGICQRRKRGKTLLCGALYHKPRQIHRIDAKVYSLFFFVGEKASAKMNKM